MTSKKASAASLPVPFSFRVTPSEPHAAARRKKIRGKVRHWLKSKGVREHLRDFGSSRKADAK
jgi:hypothetical protein